MTLELARRVSPGGQVLGVDIDDVALGLARQEAASASAGNVEYENLDVASVRFEAEFDLVFGRFVLTHMSDPVGVCDRLVRALRPGGVLAVEDVDFGGTFCWPASEGYARSVALYSDTARARGGDPDIGRRLPGLLAGAGCRDVRTSIVQPAGFGPGEQQRDVRLITGVTMETIADSAVAEGLATREELERLVNELYRLADDEGTFMSLPPGLGRRPTDALGLRAP